MSVIKAFFGLGKLPKVVKFFEFQSFDDVNKMGGAIRAIREEARTSGAQLTKSQQKYLDDQQRQVEMVFEQLQQPTTQTGIRGTQSAKILDMQGKEITPRSKKTDLTDEDYALADEPLSFKGDVRDDDKIGRQLGKLKKATPKMIDDAIENASPGFAKGDDKYNAELVAEDLAERMGLVYDDLDTRQRIEIYGQAYDRLSKRNFQVRQTEKQIAERLNKQNKKTIGNMRKKNLRDNISKLEADRDARALQLEQRGVEDFETDNLYNKINEQINDLEIKLDFEDMVDPEDLATGGRVGLFLGTTPKIAKGLSELRKLLNFFGKSSDKVKKPSDILAVSNPKRLNKYLEDVKGKVSKKGIMATDLLRDYQTKMSKDRIKTIKEMLESAKNIRQSEVQQAKLTNEIIEEMMSKGADRETAERLANVLSNLAENVAGKQSGVPKLTDEGILQLENVIKNLETGGKTARELNATGGRIGLKDGMSRRKFMQIMGGLAALPVVGKFFKTGKVAAPVVEKAAEAASGAPSYFFNLVNKIKIFGKQRQTPSYKERVNEYTYTGKDGIEYELVEDLNTGDIKITKDKTGVGTYGEETFETIEDRTEMVFRKGQADETTKGKTPPDEYDEYKVEFDQDGTPADATDIDEISKLEIIKEVSGEAPSIKKASGGIARMLGE